MGQSESHLESSAPQRPIKSPIHNYRPMSVKLKFIGFSDPILDQQFGISHDTKLAALKQSIEHNLELNMDEFVVMNSSHARLDDWCLMGSVMAELPDDRKFLLIEPTENSPLRRRSRVL